MQRGPRVTDERWVPWRETKWQEYSWSVRNYYTVSSRTWRQLMKEQYVLSRNWLLSLYLFRLQSQRETQFWVHRTDQIDWRCPPSALGCLQLSSPSSGSDILVVIAHGLWFLNIDSTCRILASAISPKMSGLAKGSRADWLRSYKQRSQFSKDWRSDTTVDLFETFSVKPESASN